MKNCLILEDNIETAYAISYLVEPLGFDCKIATTINEGRNIATVLKPDLLIIDVMIGTEDGSVFAKNYIMENLNAKCIIYTGANVPCDFPSDLIIQKPYNDKLINKIKSLFSSPENYEVIILQKVNVMENKIEQHCELLGKHEERLKNGERRFENIETKLLNIENEVIEFPQKIYKIKSDILWKIFYMLFAMTALTLGGFFITVRTTVKDVVGVEVSNQLREYSKEFKENVKNVKEIIDNAKRKTKNE